MVKEETVLLGIWNIEKPSRRKQMINNSNNKQKPWLRMRETIFFHFSHLRRWRNNTAAGPIVLWCFPMIRSEAVPLKDDKHNKSTIQQQHLKYTYLPDFGQGRWIVITTDQSFTLNQYLELFFFTLFLLKCYLCCWWKQKNVNNHLLFLISLLISITEETQTQKTHFISLYSWFHVALSDWLILFENILRHIEMKREPVETQRKQCSCNALNIYEGFSPPTGVQRQR